MAWTVTFQFVIRAVDARGPFDWHGFLEFFWPWPICAIIGILLWRRKPKA
jgi:hypothetical protein